MIQIDCPSEGLKNALEVIQIEGLILQFVVLPIAIQQIRSFKRLKKLPSDDKFSDSTLLRSFKVVLKLRKVFCRISKRACSNSAAASCMDHSFQRINIKKLIRKKMLKNVNLV